MGVSFFFFFFSSRRRHTRSLCDWSSDVCSSDLCRGALSEVSETATDSGRENGAGTTGKLLEIKGVVIDAVFPGQLPEIYSALRIPRADGGGDLIAEVQQHLGDDRVRAVAMDATDGL